MTSEIRTNSLKSRAGLSTVTMTDSGPMFSGITTFVDNSGFTFGVGGGTSIFTPATNVLTFGTNNTEKIRIDASGHMHGVGVITATHFFGNGSNLTGMNIPGGATNLDLVDSSGTGNGRVRLGASQDLQIYHDGSHSWMANDTGRLIVQTDGDQLQLRGTAVKLLNGAGSSTYASIDTNNHQLYTAGLERFRIYNDGVVAIGQSSKSSTVGAGGLDIQGNATNCIIEMGNPFPGFSGGVVPEFRITATNSSHEVKFESIWGGDNALHPHMAFTGGRTHFYRGTNSDEIARFDGVNFGINQTSPQRIVHIGSSGTAEANIRLQGGADYAELRVKDSDNVFSIHTNIGGAGSVEKLRLGQSDATLYGTTDGVLNITTTDSRGSFIRFQESGTSKVWVGCGQGLSLGAATDLGLRATNDIRMRSGTEEHAVLTADGFFAAKGMAGNWVDNTHPSSSQHHQFSNTGVNKWVMVMNQQHHAGLGHAITGNSTSNAEALWIYSNSNNSTRFRVLWNGNVGSASNSYGGISDIKLKENIVDANSQWNDIKAVKVRNFNFKDTPDTKMLGVVAQEIESISPGLVYDVVDKDPDTNKALETTTKEVKYSILYMKAIKALQEAMTRIETLEQDNIALRARVTNLEGN